MIKLKYLLDENRAMTPMKQSEWYPANLIHEMRFSVDTYT